MSLLDKSFYQTLVRRTLFLLFKSRFSLSLVDPENSGQKGKKILKILEFLELGIKKNNLKINEAKTCRMFQGEAFLFLWLSWKLLIFG